jgi:outer membrane protein assembly factor BamE (lipoprotein component of BamABCDE complex)
MKRTLIFLAAISVGALALATAASASTSTSGADVSKPDKPRAVQRPNPSLPLKKGMDAREVKARWGAPALVKPFPAPKGKAEVWTYYYTLSDQTTQVVTSTEDRMTYCGPTEGMRNVPQLVYGLKHIKVKQVVNLLLYDGVLVSWKKSIERSQGFE